MTGSGGSRSQAAALSGAALARCKKAQKPYLLDFQSDAIGESARLAPGPAARYLDAVEGLILFTLIVGTITRDLRRKA